MGFSVSGATVVIFLGALLALGAMYGAVDDGMARINNANDERIDWQIEHKNSDFKFITAKCNSTDSTLIVEAKNTGTEPIPINQTDLLVQNVHESQMTLNNKTIKNATDPRSAWLASEVLYYEFSIASGQVSQNDRVKMVTDIGITKTTKIETVCP